MEFTELVKVNAFWENSKIIELEEWKKTEDVKAQSIIKLIYILDVTKCTNIKFDDATNIKLRILIRKINPDLPLPMRVFLI